MLIRLRRVDSHLSRLWLVARITTSHRPLKIKQCKARPNSSLSPRKRKKRSLSQQLLLKKRKKMMTIWHS